MKKILALAAVVVALAGCKEATKTVDASDLLHHRFVLTTFNGEEVKSSNERPISLEFGENMMISGAMCNRFNGQATLENDVITAKNLASTRMLCSEDMLNKLDMVLQDVFGTGAKVSLKDKTLTLSTDKNTLVYQLSDLM